MDGVKKWRDLGLTYEEAVHGMQTAVLLKMLQPGQADGETSPKHLRVGVNAAMVDAGALVRLLITKGIITEEEFREELRLAMNDELATYQAEFHGITFR